MRRNLFAYVFIVGLMILNCSCQKKSDKDNITAKIALSDFGTEKTLIGAEVTFDDIVYNPYQICLIDSFLFTNDLNIEHILHVYNAYSRKKVGEFLILGNGPGEFLEPRLTMSYNSNLWMFDAGTQKLNEYSLSNLLYKRDDQPINTIKMNDYTVKPPLLVSSDTILTIRPYDAEKKFNFVDKRGLTCRSWGKYPHYLNKVNPTDAEIVQGFDFDVISNYKNRIVMAYLLTDIIEICDINGNLIKRLSGPVGFFPKVKEIKYGNISKVAPLSGSYDAYTSIKNAGEEFFVLYSGKKYENDNGLRDQLFVFDWNGKPLKRLRLNIPIFTYTVDVKNKKIYGVTASPEMRIIEYKY